ncbi:hypothetical protein [Hymenobacter psychrophilus]|uniref:Dolichyl-phosphate-mannose-protein mannosyltransferase n=1 Tax=Hymenobacter psychrophilus TaxID=651662 RepID=A0A1H3EAB7_9BACT|nr:hypothetical protein [Hymenobacter psychrophilus]SDX74839.1 hypothetical protein SAMN04488069_10319 [Hymenobacter psychrophilus]
MFRSRLWLVRHPAPPALPTDSLPHRAVLPLAAAPWLLLLAALLFVASFYQRVLHGDEAWIGEQAYWAAKEGIVRSELFDGFLGAGTRQWVYHWLFVWQAAGVIRLVGWSALVLKLISLTYLGIFALICRPHLRHYLATAAARRLFWAVLLLNALVVEYGFVFRPEIMLMCLGFGSWVLLQRWLHTGQTQWYQLVLAAALAGLAAATHLNGLIYLAAGAGLLAWRRQWSGGALFATVGGAVFALCFLDVLVHDAWGTYLRQFAPAIGGTKSGHGFALVLRALAEHKRFFHSPLETALSLLVLAAAVALYRSRWRTPRLTDATLYLLLLVVALAALSQSKTTKYLVLYLPHLCLLVAAGFERLPARPGWVRGMLAVVLGFYVIVNGVYTGLLIGQHEDRVARNQQLATQLSAYRNTCIVAPMHLVFNQIETFTIQGVTCYLVQAETRQQRPNGLMLFEEAARSRRRLIVLDDHSLKDLNLPRPVAGGTYGGYRYAYRFHDYYIYKAL